MKAKILFLALVTFFLCTSSSPIATSFPETHFLADVGTNGKVLMLDDGSVWKIEMNDQIAVALWILWDEVTVYSAIHPLGEFEYLLENEDSLDDERVYAKFMGY